MTPGHALSAHLLLAVVAMDAAVDQLEAYALEADDPPEGLVEAADSMDAARAGLVDAMTGGPRNECP